MYAHPFDDGPCDRDGTIVKHEWDFGFGPFSDYPLASGATEYACQSAHARAAVFRPQGGVASRAIAAILIPNGNERNEAAFPRRTRST